MSVRALVWGSTAADVQYATLRAAQGPSRAAWEFTQVTPVDGQECPIDVRDPGVIAADRGEHWAYAVYPVRGAP